MVEEDMEAMGWEIYPPLPELVASGEYSDFNIRCDGQLYPLHQAIVCPQSRAMRAACSAMQVRDWVTLGYVTRKANKGIGSCAQDDAYRGNRYFYHPICDQFLI